MQQAPVRRYSEQTSSAPLSSPFNGSPALSTEPEDVQEDVHLLNEATFSQNRDALTEAIDAAKTLIQDLDHFNAEQWQVRYPMPLATTAKPATRAPLLRSATSFHGKRPSYNTRSFSSADNASSGDAELPDQLPILSLPLKIDATATGPCTLAAILARMTQQDISNHLHDRLVREQKQLGDLKTRVQDKASKVLITGDLNAGKSTFVNALLKRDLMPVDQQPCTTVFCEVLDADALNGGKAEIHAIKAEHLAAYAADKPDTFATFPFDKLEEVACAEENEYALVKIYTNDVHSTEAEEAASHETLLSNGQVDISLIDAPGLNRDTISTTALFARQSEIDVVVFVVSAENHFTLSAKEFLWNAARDKAYIFVVVNKFSGIRDKQRCQRMVSEQIRQLSPLTYENREELVHYVDAASSISHDRDASFDELEASLRSFVLLKRATSKLLPAKHYLVKLLQDVAVVDEYNMAVAQAQFNTACAELEQVKPVYEKLVKAKDQISDAVAKVEESRVDDIKNAVWSRLERALSYVQQGKLVPLSEDATAPASELPYEAPSDLPPYPGVLGIFKWAVEVKETLLQSLEGEVRKAEEVARSATVQGHDEILNGLAERFLPERQSKQETERVFTPEVMFAKRRRQLVTLQAKRGVASVGLGSGLHGKVDVSILDLLDLERLNPFSATNHKVSEEEAAGALSVVSIGVGALTMFGSRAVGVRGFVETVARVADVLGSPHARKWAGPVIGVLTAGLAVYIVYDLPRAVPHNIGRKLHASMLASSTDSALQRPDSFVSKQSDRISQTSRHVLRACGYELHKRFASALEQSEEELKAVESSRSEAQGALDWLQAHLDQVEKEEERVHGVDLETHA